MSATPLEEPVRSSRVYLVLFVVIFAAATGPITIRAAQVAGLPSLYIIAARLSLTSLVLAPIVLKNYRSHFGRLSRRAWMGVVASGVTFSLNLILLFVSLEYTSVLVTGVLRRTSPLWVIWLEIVLLGAVFTRRVWLGLALTLAGSLLVTVGGAGAIEAGRNPGLGALLALGGAVSIGLYLLIGRSFRHQLPTLAYSWLVFTTAALITIAAVAFTGTPVAGYGLEGVGWVLIVTFVTQFLGHIPLNLGLHYFQATSMSIIMQAAVVASALMAFLFFGEVPSLMQAAGSLIIMGGVMLASRN